MKKFQFKLQPLLKYREYQEKLAQQETASAQMDVKKSEEQIENLKQTYSKQDDTIRKITTDGISASQFQQHYQYLMAVGNSVQEEKIRKAQLKEILKQKLLALKKKSVDKKAMEIYKDRLKDMYTREMIQAEQKELDEITTLKTARDRAQ